MSDIIDAEKAFRISALEKQLKKLNEELKEAQKENDKLKILLKEADPEASADLISDAEFICINEIKKLKESSVDRELSNDEVKNFEVLYKTLDKIQGKNPRKVGQGSAKNLTIEELEEIAKGF